MNNPLMFNDPSGEYIFGITEAFVAAIVIGAMVGTASYIINTIITGQKFTLLGYFKAEFFGALSGAVTYGIGSVFTSTATGIGQFAASIGKVGSAFLQATAHGIAQGTLSLMQGADLSSAGMAAITGFVTSGVMSGITSINPSITKSMGTSMITGGVVGGVSSKLAGGNFWQGAAIGAIVAGLNHYLHSIVSKSEMENIIERAKYNPSDKGTIEATKDIVKKSPELQELNVNGGIKDIVPYDQNDGRYGYYNKNTKTINLNTFNNKSLLDYVLTAYHELRHHYFWYKTGLYESMRNEKIDGKSSWGILSTTDGLNFNEYQAHRATEIISGGYRGGNNVESNATIIQKHIESKGYNLRMMNSIFIKAGGFYPKPVVAVP